MREPCSGSSMHVSAQKELEQKPRVPARFVGSQIATGR